MKNQTNDLNDVKPQTPSARSRLQSGVPKSQRPDPDSKSKAQTLFPKTPNLHDRRASSLPDFKSLSAAVQDNETTNPAEKDTQTEDEWKYITIEPSDEPGKTNTGVVVKPKTADASTDTKEDTDCKSGYGISAFASSGINTTTADGIERRYRLHDSFGSQPCDSAKCLNRYSCGYLQSPMSADIRYQRFATQRDMFSDMVKPLQHCTHTSNSGCCSRRL